MTPLIKKQDLDRVFKNYRPVSNLSFVSKVVESAAISQYRDHLEMNNQMPTRNAAYTKFHSTETILARIQSDILLNMDQQRISLLVLLDLSAAFDTIDYTILSKIFQHKFKITGTVANWFASYLTNRQQRIMIDNVLSSPMDLKFGVPQGSCAGPVIFLSYLSSLYDTINNFDINVGGFADDNQLYLSFKPTSDGIAETEAVNVLIQCVSAVRSWMLQHKLKINDDKTEFLIIGGRQQLCKVKNSNIIVGNSSISSTSSARNLGVIFDENMSMKNHISSVCKKGFYQLYRLKQIRNYFDKGAIERLVHSFITSHIDYGNSLLFGLPNSSILKLQRLQNAAARLILRRNSYASVTDMFKELHWLPVNFRIKFKVALLVFKCVNDVGPSYLSDILVKKPLTRTLRSSADGLLLLVPRVKTESFGKRSFQYAAPSVWNSLPLSVRNSQSIDIFKKTLKTHFYGLAFM